MAILARVKSLRKSEIESLLTCMREEMKPSLRRVLYFSYAFVAHGL